MGHRGPEGEGVVACLHPLVEAAGVVVNQTVGEEAVVAVNLPSMGELVALLEGLEDGMGVCRKHHPLTMVGH